MIFTPSLIDSSNAHAWIIEGVKGEAHEEFVSDMIHHFATGSLDIVYMDKTANKGGYCREDINAFIQRMHMGSFGPHLVGVIDEADILSEAQQNKLLKTLEEPEAGVIILLACTNSESLLHTVRSRCAKLRIADAVAGQSAEEAKSQSEIDLADFQTDFFYAYRNAVDKKIKTREDAIALLNAMEDELRSAMLTDGNALACAEDIELIEEARADIYRGMKFDKALKRLYLELGR